MRKVAITLGIVLLSGGILMAQDKKSKKSKKEAAPTETQAAPAPAAAPAAPASNLKPEDMAFKYETHDFGVVSEGPDAAYEFVFKNNGKEPIIVQKAQPSCGCTVPSFSSAPVLPGADGTIKVEYHTKGRPGPFTKTISVVSNAGTRVISIKGNVEKAPTTSVPENTSMMKTN